MGKPILFSTYTVIFENIPEEVVSQRTKTLVCQFDDPGDTENKIKVSKHITEDLELIESEKVPKIAYFDEF